MKVGRTANGYVVRVFGRGTMRESHSFHRFTNACTCDADCHLVVDLANCTYLDSTFVGGLIALHKQFGDGDGRFSIAASDEQTALLLAPLRLQDFFHIISEPPEVVGETVTLFASNADERNFGRHVMECHQLLSELEGPNQAMFAHITKKLAADLDDS